MKRVFICSPYHGDVENNLKAARKYTKMVVVAGYCPFAPHLFFPQILDDKDPEERMKGITLGVEQMKVCDEVWVFGTYISKGMGYELEKAKELRIPVQLYDADENRINPATLMIDERVSEEYCKAIYGLEFVV